MSDGKDTADEAHRAVDDAVYKLSDAQRLGLGKSEVRNIITDLWPAIVKAFRPEAASEAPKKEGSA